MSKYTTKPKPEQFCFAFPDLDDPQLVTRGSGQGESLRHGGQVALCTGCGAPEDDCQSWRLRGAKACCPDCCHVALEAV